MVQCAVCRVPCAEAEGEGEGESEMQARDSCDGLMD